MNFDKEAESDEKKSWGGGGGGGGRELKPKQYARLCLHNVEHVVQSTFQNTLIPF